ncbi:MAG: DUF2130 domain-containing protein [Candidatus Saccharimonadaceae bacterium]|nr:DUF2130 domain-containing protein [Candidatus Saccharimonadaceae bacterium]
MKHEIKCPKCGEVFAIDESSYAEIQNQVRNNEFDLEVENRLHAIKESNRKDLEIVKQKTAGLYERKLDEKNQEVLEVKNHLENKIRDLQTKLDNAKLEQQLAVELATKQVEKNLNESKLSLKTMAIEKQNELLALEDRYKYKIEQLVTERDFYKDLKQQLSTKMVGETLEQHCEREFNKIRAAGFKNAYFGKDNDARSGSKGDFIYRECDDDGNEIISIMFEMKNENETTATKHKNEHFFKELDKDRNEKKCEYAVLVSMLELDNDYYNAGIVDVSYQSGFNKMYVVRPQCFIPIITILRNAALNTIEAKAELAQIRNQNIDITNFEAKLNQFKEKFALNSDRATTNFKKAIEDIDKSIKNLEDTKEALLRTIKNFDAANNKLDDLTIKRLTRGNKTMAKKFEDLKTAV